VTESKRATTSAGLFLLCLPFLLLQPPMVTAFCFEEAATQYGLSPRLLRSIATVESSCRPSAVHVNTNGSTDLGMMQVNSSWITKLGLDRGKLLQDPCYNVMTGARILRQCVDRFGYTWEAVGCYNALSRDKRVDYSWKILRELKEAPRQPSAATRERARARIETLDRKDSLLMHSVSPLKRKNNDQQQTVADGSKRPRSFYFRVRAEVPPGELVNP
jgi:soluble lytic murein transglycosylase-like protein